MPTGFEFYPEVKSQAPGTQKILMLGRFFTDYVGVQSGVAASAITLANFIETLSFLIVQNFEHTLAAPARASMVIAPYQIRKAKDFALAYAHLPITVTDMAEAAGVSVRALQHNFRHFLDASPSLYLRDLLLDEVRQEIQHAPPTAIVADIARRLGVFAYGQILK